MRASKKGHADSVRVLVEEGHADVNIQNNVSHVEGWGFVVLVVLLSVVLLCYVYPGALPLCFHWLLLFLIVLYW